MVSRAYTVAEDAHLTWHGGRAGELPVEGHKGQAAGLAGPMVPITAPQFCHDSTKAATEKTNRCVCALTRLHSQKQVVARLDLACGLQPIDPLSASVTLQIWKGRGR